MPLTQEEDARFEELAGELIVADPPTDPPVDPPAPKVDDHQAALDAEKARDVEKATRGGIWKPKEEFVADGGDPDEWVSARRFNMDGKRQARYRDMEGRLARNDQQTRAVVDHIKATEKKRADDAIDAVKNEKWTALEAGDLEGARKAEVKEDALRNAPAPEIADQGPPANDSLWQAVEEVHPGARRDSETQEFRDWLPQQPHSVQYAYHQSNDPRDGVEVFDRFNKSKGKTQRTPPPVIEPRRASPQPKVTGYDGLSREAKSTYLEFQRLGMASGSKESKAEYARECVERGEA